MAHDRHLRLLPHASINVQANAASQSVAAAEVKQLEPEKRSTLEIGRRIAFTLALAAEER